MLIFSIILELLLTFTSVSAFTITPLITFTTHSALNFPITPLLTLNITLRSTYDITLGVSLSTFTLPIPRQLSPSPLIHGNPHHLPSTLACHHLSTNLDYHTYVNHHHHSVATITITGVDWTQELPCWIIKFAEAKQINSSAGFTFLLSYVMLEDFHPLNQELLGTRKDLSCLSVSNLYNDSPSPF